MYTYIKYDIPIIIILLYIYTHTRIECVCISFSHYRISLTRKRITKELRRRELGRVCVSYIVTSAGSPMRESSVELCCQMVVRSI